MSAAASIASSLRTILLIVACLSSALAQRASVSTAVVELTVGAHGGDGGGEESSSLSSVQATIRTTLRTSPATSFLVTLRAGAHAVPAGGLLLTAADSPSEGHRVTWVGEPGASVSGGVAITGWKPAQQGWALQGPGVPPGLLPEGTMVAPVPPSLLGATLRHLYVGGVRAERTRRAVGCADPGGCPHGGTIGAGALPGLVLEVRKDCIACSYALPAGADVLNWSNVGDVELVYSGVSQGWSEARCALDSVEAHPSAGSGAPSSLPALNCTAADGEMQPDCGGTDIAESDCLSLGCCWRDPPLSNISSHCTRASVATSAGAVRVQMKQPCFSNLVQRAFQPVGFRPPAFVENVREHLLTPGEFYYDRARAEVLYVPRSDADAALLEREAFLAVEETLMRLDGASNQVFRGLTFEFGTWLRPMQGGGYVEQQAAACDLCPRPPNSTEPIVFGPGCGANDEFVETPGNIDLIAARDVAFEGCTFRHLGGFAASARGGSRRVAWRRCAFHDVSAGALMLGGVRTENITDTAKWDGEFTVEDCTIRQMPVEYVGSSAIFAGYVDSSVIQHNLFENTSYSGLTLGWGWGREGSRRGENRVQANHFRGFCRVMGVAFGGCDGGAVYTLGPQPGSTIVNNFIEALPEQGHRDGGGTAIYHDNGSGGFVDTGNVIKGNGTLGSVLKVNGSGGKYGPAGACPGPDGKPKDCSISFTSNFEQTTAPSSGNSTNVSVAANVKIAWDEALPAAAQAVVDSAGPRKA